MGNLPDLTPLDLPPARRSRPAAGVIAAVTDDRKLSHGDHKEVTTLAEKRTRVPGEYTRELILHIKLCVSVEPVKEENPNSTGLSWWIQYMIWIAGRAMEA